MMVKLAEALLRRKELNEKVDSLRAINKENLFVTKTGRKPVHEGIDDIIASVPKIALTQVTAAFDYYAKHLRLIDAAIQQANWTTTVEVEGDSMSDWIDPYVEDN